MINKVLIANRGEIAVRIIRSVHDAGLRSVAVYSEVDRLAPHVALADESVCIGEGPVAGSYLDAAKILAAAAKTGADAIHPGYGFLSENDEFARMCGDEGINFIGPAPDAILLMGNKRIAKQRMIDAGVPCIPGYQGADQSDEVLIAEAGRVGYPLMVKAASGGGGRGMRLLESADGLAEALTSARTEALNAFGSDELILERAVSDARHIEIQIAADKQGNTIYLGERDCSIQRRHQKVIEEAPSPFVDETLRKKMGESAVNAAKACGYFGVGTVEFLVDASGDFYFLEMNTRLQVEHPVTELITGVDLVDWQLRIACGEDLPLAQSDVVLSGHAIEARLYAEDPANGFMPQTGPVLVWREAQGTGVRIDAGIAEGGVISPHYDPMLAKIICVGRSREEARKRLARALRETCLLGVCTNASFLGQVIADQRFVEGAATTAFIDGPTLDAASEAAEPAVEALALAAVLVLINREQNAGSTWGWSNTQGLARTVKLSGDIAASVSSDDLSFSVTIGDVNVELEIQSIEAPDCTCVIDGVRRNVLFAHINDEVHIHLDGQTVILQDQTYLPALSKDGAGSGNIVSTTEGAVIAVEVSAGDRVTKGQMLVTLEAMKMEHRLLADGDGTVVAVHAQINTQVKKGHVMVELDLDEVSEG